MLHRFRGMDAPGHHSQFLTMRERGQVSSLARATDSDNWLGDREQFNICPSISSLFLRWRGAKAYFKNIWETIPGFSPWIRHWIAARFPYLLYTLAVTIIAAPDMGRKTRPK